MKFSEALRALFDEYAIDEFWYHVRDQVNDPDWEGSLSNHPRVERYGDACSSGWTPTTCFTPRSERDEEPYQDGGAAGGQKRVADATGVDQSLLSRICSGERNWSTDTASKLLAFFTDELGYKFTAESGYDMLSVPRI